MWFFAYFLLHLLIYSLLRIEFLVWNWASLKNLPFLDILTAFIYGLRFDLSALSLLVGLCFVGLLWMKPKTNLLKTWVGIFIIANSIFYLINAADVELFNFTAKRFSSSAFYMIGEGAVTDYITPYLGLAGVSVLIIVGYVVAAIQLSQKYNFQFNLKNKAVLSFVFLLLSVVFSRGGLQHKPLTFVDAKLFDNTYANNLVLNSTFTVLKSLGRSSLERVKFYENNELLSLLNQQDITAVKAESKNLNVMIVILESFSKEYLELKNPEATPYLNNLRKKSLDFEHAYANGRRSIEGVAAILSGIPALMEEPFINSEFSANQIIGLGSILNSHNYQTSFFHGASNGTMHFDRFTKSVGIENYYGLNEYPDRTEFDGSWGIFDEPYLQWTCKKQTEIKEPFFTTVFTLSSHQPYNIPEKYKEKFKDDRLDILKSVRYTDYALEQFIKCAEQQPWYQNTLFIFTADHTGPFLNENSSFETRYQIPLVVFSPQKELLKNINTQQYVQHIDLLPTILDVLKIEHKNINYLSRSLLRSGDKVIALYADHHYQLVGNIKDPEKQLKAIQQYFSEGLYDNRLYYPVR